MALQGSGAGSFLDAVSGLTGNSSSAPAANPVGALAGLNLGSLSGVGGGLPSGLGGLTPGILSALASYAQSQPANANGYSGPSITPAPGAPGTNQNGLFGLGVGPYPFLSSIAGQNAPGTFGVPPTPGAPTAATGAAAPQLSLADVLTAILGQAPSAPTAAEFGAAPTLSDFFSAAPYQQAQSQLTAGTGAAKTAIGSAYQQAANALAGITKNAQAETASSQAQSNADANSTQGLANQYIGGANAAAGPGGGVAGMLSGLQAAIAGQNGAAKTLDSQLAGIQNNNLSQQAGQLTGAQQNALNLLASQSAGEGSKISLAQAADQATGEKDLAAANNSRGAAETTANNDYQTALSKYQATRGSLLTSAYKTLAGGTGAAADTADTQASQWLQQGSAGNQAAQNQFNAYTAAMNTNVTATGKPPTTAAEALSNLQAAVGVVGGLTPAEIDAVASNITAAYQKGTNTTAVTPQSIAQYLSSMVG